MSRYAAAGSFQLSAIHGAAFTSVYISLVNIFMIEIKGYVAKVIIGQRNNVLNLWVIYAVQGQAGSVLLWAVPLNGFNIRSTTLVLLLSQNKNYNVYNCLNQANCLNNVYNCLIIFLIYLSLTSCFQGISVGRGEQNECA